GYGVGVAADGGDESRTKEVIPVDFYKAEDSNVFSSDLFGSIFASYQRDTPSSIPIGGLDKDMQYYADSWHNTYYYFDVVGQQRQANLHVSKFFNTGQINPQPKL